MPRRKVYFDRTCPTCGRRWEAEGGWTGFLWASADNHEARCKHRTPQERMKIAKRDHKRYQKHPTRATITINWNDPGLHLGG